MFADMIGGAGAGGAAGAGGMNPMQAMMLQVAMQGMMDPAKNQAPTMQAPVSPRGQQIQLKGTKQEQDVKNRAPSLAQLVFGGL